MKGNDITHYNAWYLMVDLEGIEPSSYTLSIRKIYNYIKRPSVARLGIPALVGVIQQWPTVCFYQLHTTV